MKRRLPRTWGISRSLAFTLAKQFRKAPQEIAQSIAGAWDHAHITASAAGPYVNLTFDRGYYGALDGWKGWSRRKCRKLEKASASSSICSSPTSPNRLASAISVPR
ncbi:hypothetical protein VQ056_31015 [Paenibacillus sp. JTLBN-2024]